MKDEQILTSSACSAHTCCIETNFKLALKFFHQNRYHDTAQFLAQFF